MGATPLTEPQDRTVGLVAAAMAAQAGELEVFGPVVAAVAIAVVDYLRGQQPAAEQGRHD